MAWNFQHLRRQSGGLRRGIDGAESSGRRKFTGTRASRGQLSEELLLALQGQYPIIGDVRGSGLFLGVDLVVDPVTRSASTAQAAYVVNRLRECGVLTGTDGPSSNVIKLRPPLIISESDVDVFIGIFRSVLAEDPAQHV